MKEGRRQVTREDMKQEIKRAKVGIVSEKKNIMGEDSVAVNEKCMKLLA